MSTIKPLRSISTVGIDVRGRSRFQGRPEIHAVARHVRIADSMGRVGSRSESVFEGTVTSHDAGRRSRPSIRTGDRHEMIFAPTIEATAFSTQWLISKTLTPTPSLRRDAERTQRPIRFRMFGRVTAVA